MLRRLLALVFLWTAVAAAAKGPIYIGLDAEFGHATSTSAQAIRQGMEIAMDEINRAGGLLGGRRLELVVRDNRSLPAVGVDHLRELAAIPDLVAVFGGRFSPVYIESLPVAHELGIPLMDPWGSADPITDHGLRPSFSFRLSLKDAWAAPAFVRFAREHHGATKLAVLLPNTAWGRSNQAAIMRAAAAGGASVVGERWYNWGDASLLDQYQELRLAGAQALILVANEGEGALLVREMAALPESERLPIVSHWGITGGQFARQAGEALQKVDLAVIQTVSFVGNERPAARRVLAALQQRYGIASADQVTSPAGVAHAYDLTHLLARAIRQAGSTDRRRIRTALEQLGPYDGLVRHYQRPFAPDRHDALAETDVIFARYAAGGERLLPVPSAGRP